jgi:hypothetical protein
MSHIYLSVAVRSYRLNHTRSLATDVQTDTSAKVRLFNLSPDTKVAGMACSANGTQEIASNVHYSLGSKVRECVRVCVRALTASVTALPRVLSIPGYSTLLCSTHGSHAGRLASSGTAHTYIYMYMLNHGWLRCDANQSTCVT